MNEAERLKKAIETSKLAKKGIILSIIAMMIGLLNIGLLTYRILNRNCPKETIQEIKKLTIEKKKAEDKNWQNFLDFVKEKRGF